MRGLSQAEIQKCNFTLKMNTEHRELENQQESNINLFNRSKVIIDEIKEMLGGNGGDDTAKKRLIDVYGEFTAETMAHLIFGSNMQERAGMGYDETYKLCLEVFNGNDIDPADIDPRSEEYQREIGRLRSEKIENDPKMEHVIRSRREVIQHAQALIHITTMALDRDEPLTEELIKETHKIMCEGLDGNNAVQFQPNWAGEYRNCVAGDGTTTFCDPSMVPAEMRKFVKAFNEDVRRSEKSGDIDPFFLAADICQDFVMIHPSRDGNGRMCRLVANAYLIKYAGVMISIGEHDEDRKDYLNIVMVAAEIDREEEGRGMLASFFLSKAAGTLARLKQKLHKDKN